MKKSLYGICGLSLALACASTSALATDCKGLPNHAQLKAALSAAQNHADKNGGFGLEMWASIVNRDGFVCAVAYSGANRNSQWPGSRLISAQKAYTANAFSLDGLALSTANLYGPIQPGGSLFGLQHSNPMDPAVAYFGNPVRYGTATDPLVGKKIGGINGFGGGLGLYKKVNGKKVIMGAVGVSGDSSCADHNIAWRTRKNLAGFNVLPTGVSASGDDGIVYDTNGIFTGWEHTDCGHAEKAVAIAIGAGK
jgi:uncharacterized protein GlcG (DUF336 family)